MDLKDYSTPIAPENVTNKIDINIPKVIPPPKKVDIKLNNSNDNKVNLIYTKDIENENIISMPINMNNDTQLNSINMGKNRRGNKKKRGIRNNNNVEE